VENTSSGLDFGGMGLADEDVRHQLVIAGAVADLALLQGDVRRQLQVLQGLGKLRPVERFRLLGRKTHRVHADIAEPVARGRRLLGRGAIVRHELDDLRHVRLVPPPFHRPPAGLRIGRAGLDALQLEQRAAERHLFLHAELRELLHAVDLGEPAHVVEQHVGLVGLGLDQRRREIGGVDRQEVALIFAAGLGQRLDEGILQGVAVGIVGRDKEPFLAELLDEFGRDRVGVHGRGVADAEDVPLAVGAGDRVGMAARHDVEHLLLVGDLRHRIGDAGIDVAEDHGDLVAVDQLARLLNAGADVVGGIFDQELDLTAENAALLVDFGLGIFGAVNLALRERREHAGQRVDHSNLDRLVGKRLDDEGSSNHLARANGDAGLDERTTIEPNSCGHFFNLPEFSFS
jgi:hypothetical protein